MKDTQNYIPGYQLAEDEYLLKIRYSESSVTGFLTKLNQNGTVPKKFEDWGIWKYSREPQIPLPICVFTEKFRAGWKLDHFRIGESQQWAALMHPYGFIVEIYLTDFLQIVKTNSLIEGVLQGEFKWQNNKLIKQ